MKRRDFISFLGSAAAAWPSGAFAQQSALPLIGYVGPTSPGPFASRLQAFLAGLAETGFVEGQNVRIEYRWAEGHNERLPALVGDMVRQKPAVIVTPGGLAGGLAAKAATVTIPIVFETGADPVAAGLVPTLNRPGGNITGVSSLNAEVAPKRLELLHELSPNASALALLNNPNSPTAETSARAARVAAQTLGVELHAVNASSEEEIDAAFSVLKSRRVGGIAIHAEPFFVSRIGQIASLGLRHAMPTAFFTREFAAAGGLISYGGSITESHRIVGTYTGRILKGEKPADLPVQQSTRVELVINMKTAKALGLTFPLTLLGRADEVIE